MLKSLSQPWFPPVKMAGFQLLLSGCVHWLLDSSLNKDLVSFSPGGRKDMKKSVKWYTEKYLQRKDSPGRIERASVKLKVSYEDTAIRMMERGEKRKERGREGGRETEPAREKRERRNKKRDQVTVKDTALECGHWHCRPEFKFFSLSLSRSLSRSVPITRSPWIVEKCLSFLPDWLIDWILQCGTTLLPPEPTPPPRAPVPMLAKVSLWLGWHGWLSATYGTAWRSMVPYPCTYSTVSTRIHTAPPSPACLSNVIQCSLSKIKRDIGHTSPDIDVYFQIADSEQHQPK